MNLRLTEFLIVNEDFCKFLNKLELALISTIKSFKFNLYKFNDSTYFLYIGNKIGCYCEKSMKDNHILYVRAVNEFKITCAGEKLLRLKTMYNDIHTFYRVNIKKYNLIRDTVTRKVLTEDLGYDDEDEY